jgi:hypothetical protein
VNKLIIEASCEVDGVEYHAVSDREIDKPSCDGCAGLGTGLCFKLGACTPGSRFDSSNVIWVRAE